VAGNRVNTFISGLQIQTDHHRWPALNCLSKNNKVGTENKYILKKIISELSALYFCEKFSCFIFVVHLSRFLTRKSYGYLERFVSSWNGKFS
jgi:hypothetical protein